ncbi:helix-turn-helix domain-containing protein [Paracoccus aminophilus]|uniref:helix-turn-helix domain-containing protein n=1 Tax=Paracoccus aminophilus TaxID=34003 RepID=UPI0009FCFF4D
MVSSLEQAAATTLTLLTPAEAARALRISTKTLQRLRNRGLPFVMLTSGTIRYRPDDLTNFIEGHTECRTARKERASGTTTSKSGVFDFMALAAQKTMKRPRP